MEGVPAEHHANLRKRIPSPVPPASDDTSDTLDATDIYLDEYEIASFEAEERRFYCSDESIDECIQQDSFQNELLMVTSRYSKENSILGDTSEENSTSPTSNSDVDPELPRNDYLDFEKCLLCKTDKKKISYPYCSKCFLWRKNLFPSRPKRRKKSLISTHGSGSLTNVNSQNQSNPPDENTADVASQPSTSSGSTTSRSNPSSSNISEVCRVCFLKPEAGLFIHLNIAHIYGCYTCAKEIWYSTGGCPLCRGKVYKVVKLFK